MTIYCAYDSFPAISSVSMHSAGRILLLPCTGQIIQILETEYVTILGCQLPGILIRTTVSTTFCFSQHPLLLCTCSTFSKNAFTFPLMKYKTPSTATLDAGKSAALGDFIHTQCVKRYLVHDLEKISTNRGGVMRSITYCTTNFHPFTYCVLCHILYLQQFLYATSTLEPVYFKILLIYILLFHYLVK